MKYCVIGSGGREHALSWRLWQDSDTDAVYVIPGNGGIDPEWRVDLPVDDAGAIADFCENNGVEYVLIGPEAPLAAGLADALEEKGLYVFGPSAAAARLESSKMYAKTIMEKYGVPTAAYNRFTGKDEILAYIDTIESYPVVIKLDGLAAGKGVALPENREEALEFINDKVGDKTSVLIEEFFQGEEVSVMGISDGTTVKALVPAQDHKRAYDGDKGPNTGGMGAYAPAPVLTSEMLSKVEREVLQPTVDGMRAEGIPFKGVLYAGLMITEGEIKVLEFNVRFGDPEAQVILPLVEGSFGQIIQAAVHGRLHAIDVASKDSHAMTVVLASGGYPGSYAKGLEIEGVMADYDEVIIFHAGTKEEKGRYYSQGGRVLAVTGTGKTLQEARDRAYDVVETIRLEGSFYRSDIGHRAL